MLLGGVGRLDFLGESSINDVAVNAARGAAGTAVATSLLGAKAVGFRADQGIRDSHFDGGGSGGCFGGMWDRLVCGEVLECDDVESRRREACLLCFALLCWMDG